MSQSNTIFAVTLFLFVVYITAKGKLGRYLALFKPREKDEDAGSTAKAKKSSLPSLDDFLKGFDLSGGGDLGNIDPDISFDDIGDFDTVDI